MFTVRITTWINGVPTTVRSILVESKEQGMETLRALGHSWDLNPHHIMIPDSAGYLYEGETMIGRLDVFQYTYRVWEVVSPQVGCSL